jgi:hypothetical protein
VSARGVRGEQKLPLNVGDAPVERRSGGGARARWLAYLAVSVSVDTDGQYRVELVRKEVGGHHVLASLLDSGAELQPTLQDLASALSWAAERVATSLQETGALPS